MLDQLTVLSGDLSGLLWGNWITLGGLLGVGLYLTIRLGVVQFRGFKHSIHIIQGKYRCKGDKGDVSHFQALSTALSATIGTGNIAGVATAISLGGPGALFWMWVTAFLGMATKFTESTLALNFREIDKDGVSGGPMYTLLNGLKMKRTAMFFAFFAAVASFGIGNLVQVNSVVDGLAFIEPGVKEYSWVVGVTMAMLVGMVILGGVKRIAKVASTIVPFMAIVYISVAMIVLINEYQQIPAAISTIFNHALNPWAVGGAAVGEAIRWGVARGLFSNEAGLGSSPMAHAAATTNEPVREGLVAMMEPFVDTLVICSMTGLAIVVTGAYITAPEDVTGASLTAYAFSQSIGDAGAIIVGGGLALFAFSTIIAWSYYGDRSVKFMFGEKAVLPYRVVYTMLIVVGAIVPLKLVWNIADVTNILMAVPNLIALILLSALVKKMKDEYFEKHQK
ncbi:MAG: sodium:alanine symporter family protein [endosymbiont of Galathealinum brachiosum]|uniref:Sodium:alanine symporter family protein n=1 Tax=endosymbiont of Galathealinum brachiosum TaxID=2200906 RepID=A0A370DC48_9GAMM|nr:MAG: sodium:alanine symporter family protein [endosymbiont of Galathealinum brachiosum]